MVKRLAFSVLTPNDSFFRQSNFMSTNRKKKRNKLTSAQRIFIWERPKMYGRTCSICHQRITKMSELEMDHTKSFKQGGKKLSLAHRDCNRMKHSGSLAKIQKQLGLKLTKRKKSIKSKSSKKTKRTTNQLVFGIRPQRSLWG